MAKIIIFEDDLEPVVIETDSYIVSDDRDNIVTNLAKDGLITNLAKLAFLAFMKTLSGEDTPSDSAIPPQQNVREEVRE